MIIKFSFNVGSVKILTKKTNKKINLTHNKVKNYIFQEGEFIPS